jgi:hypothetical protein
MKRIISFVALFLVVGLVVPTQANAKIKVGKALKRSAAAVSATVRHPAVTTKGVSLGVFDTFLTGVESVGVVVETVGVGIQKAGVLVYDVGEVLAGGYGSSPAPTQTPTKQP